MNGPTASGLKTFIIFVLFIGFMFLLIEQRLESKEYDLQLNKLQDDIEILQSQKREVGLRIDYQEQRIASFDYSRLGKPLSMKDVIFVSVKDDSCLENKKEDSHEEEDILDILIKKLILAFL